MIYFIQPAVPRYRKPFFDKLSEKYRVRVYTTECDFLNVKSIPNLPYAIYSSGFLSFFTRAFWHKNLPGFWEFTKDDLVVINGNVRVLNYMFMFVALKLTGVKTVWWGHGWSANSHGLSAKVRLKLMKLISDKQLLYTDFEKNAIGGHTVFSLNNGLDSNEINSAISKTSEKLTNSALNIVFIGRVTEKSNFSVLLNALALLKLDFHLHVIGSIDIPDIQQYAKKLSVDQDITWYGSMDNELDIASVMLACDLFVYPGSVGLSIIHAFNYGLPVLVHNHRQSHMPEFASFEEYYNGLSFAEGNATSLANRITEFSSMSLEERQVMSQNAKSTIIKSYNIDDMVNRFELLIQDV